ncbi:MAG TPA: amino acid adenylation domain-containing protein [Candidatus Angelobacter sp.]|jgi:amino acid adenylation domain-containing protein
MNCSDLLTRLHTQGIRIQLVGEKIRLSIPSGELDPDVREEIKLHREEIKSLLRQPLAEDDNLLAKQERPARLPLSYGQQRLWFVDRLEGTSREYNIVEALRLLGELNLPALEKAIKTIVERHEVLRTHFQEAEGEPWQVVEPALPIQLALEDWRELEGEEKKRKVAAAIREEGEKAFALEQGPILRARVLRLEEQEHVLLRTVHHIASDGWSGGIFNQELMVLYEAYCQGEDNPLPELPLQYADYTLWQRSREARGELEEGLKYWKQQLDGITELRLPADPKPEVPRYAGAVERSVLSAELTGKIRQLSQETQATMFMTLLAGFMVLLARYSGQEDIVVGSPTANRQDSRLEELIGFFVNTLVLRARLDGDTSSRRLLEEVRRTALEAYRYQEVPFERVVEELSPERSLSRTPLFQIVFAFQNDPWIPQQLAGLAIREIQLEEISARYDLVIQASEEDGKTTLVCVYRQDLFDKWRIEQMLRHYERILAAVVDNPTLEIDEIGLLTATEREEILYRGRATRTHGGGKCFLDLLVDQVNRTPDAPAISYEDRTLTYKQIHEAAGRWARRLAALGIGPEDLVAIYLERGCEFIIALLSVWKAGGAYLPLDLAVPTTRVLQILNYARPSVLIVSERDREKLETGNVRTITVEELASDSGAEYPESGFRTASPENIAYAIFTSGSTGTPKGVAIQHGSLVNFCQALQHRIHAESGCLPRNAGLNASMAFDASLKQLGLLLHGGHLFIVPELARRSGPELLAFIQKYSLDAIDLTPSQMTLLLDAGLREAQIDMTFLIGGEAIHVDLWNILGSQPQLHCYNHYGPTECTVNITVGRIQQEDKAPNLGRPLENIEVYILDRRCEPVPIGVGGELYIGGAGLARGYLNRAALTAERFVANPFGPPGSRIYRTGDLARWRRDGALEFIGRNDRQVKLRGFRIELDEIEFALRSLPGIKDAVVIFREDGDGNNYLAGYVVPFKDVILDPGQVRRELSSILPAYMVPAIVMAIAGLPHTLQGKIDQNLLPRPFFHDAGEKPAPKRAEEEILCGIFADVLGVAHVGADDNFFDSGGHSLLAMRLVNRIRSVMGVDISVRTLFAAPTVRGLLANLEKDAPRHLKPLEPQVRPEHLPLSWEQQRLWFVDRLQGGSPEYNIPETLKLIGKLDYQALQQAVNTILDRHEALRTHFAEVAGRPVQRIAAELRIALLPEDLSALNTREKEARVVAAIENEWRQPFDLQQGPLLRMQLLKTGEQEHILLRTFHHIVSDGWSLGVFDREFTELYNAYHEKRESRLAPLRVQYADFALWQQEMFDEKRLRPELDYWKEQLVDLPELELPKDRQRPSAQTFAAERWLGNSGKQLTAEMKRLSREAQVTLYMALLAAFTIVLERYSGQEDIVLGSPIANRHDAQLEELIGFFVNSLVLRVRVKRDQNFLELLDSVRRTALEAYRHQHLPFERLVEEISPKRSLNRTPVFQVTFALQNTPTAEQSLSGVRTEAVEAEGATVRFDLEVRAWEEGEELRFSWLYNRDLFDRWRIAQMGQHYICLLRKITANPRLKLAKVPFLDEKEQVQILEGFNPAPQFVPAKTVHELFEEQAWSHGDEEAVVYETESLVYGELNRRANQLAHYLRRLGVGPERLVAIYMDRSPEMVVGLLAVLKAGGAYVPLDPTYPVERLAYSLTNSKPTAILTQTHFKRALADILEGNERTVIDVSTECDQWREMPETDLEVGAIGLKPEHLVYVIYTSGSTGAPKGVMVEHRNVVNYLLWTQQSYYIGHTGGSPALHSIAFDGIITTLLGPLISGQRLRLLPPGDEIESLVQQWRNERRTPENTYALIKMTPSHLKLLNQCIQEERNAPPARALMIGGEPLEESDVRLWQEQFPQVRLVNHYGPTEATVGCATYEIPATPEGKRSVPIGRPLANARLYILDAHGDPVPVGVEGELYIGGAGVARGYLNLPELTEERFVNDPFTSGKAARMYKTGDLARWRPDGTIEFAGRKDFQVKLRGFRIELGEIEACLRGHDAIAEAAIVVHEGRKREKQLVAYYTCKTTREDARAQLTPQDLRSYSARKLPEYMVPAAYVRLDKMPLTSHGKLDHAALPRPEEEAYPLRLYEAPVGETETTIAEIWAEELELERVGRQDNFFEIGGHSLLAVKVIEKARGRGIQMKVRDLFAHPVLSEFASAAVQTEESFQVPPNLIPPDCRQITPEMLTLVKLTPEGIAAIVAQVEGGAANVQDIYPLALLQEGILFHHLMEGHGDPYLLGNLLSFDSRDRMEIYMEALKRVIERHDILRTAVQWEGLAEPVQVVWRRAELPVEQIEFEATEGDIAEQMLRRFDPRRYRMDVRRAPLLKVYTAYDSRRGRWLMMLLRHHLVSDHTAVEVLQHEVEVQVHGNAEQLKPSRPFRNLVARACLASKREEHERFFRAMLADVEEPTAPFGLLEAHRDGTAVLEGRRSLDPNLARRIKQSARRLKVSVTSLWHLGWAQVVGRVSGRDDVVFGTVLFGRMGTGEESDHMMGPFMNTLPIRIQIGEKTVEESVRQVHAALTELMRHEHASLALAQRCSGVPSPLPIFTALLNYRHSTGASSARSGEWMPVEEGVAALRMEERTNYPFTMSVDDLGEGFQLTMQVQGGIEPFRVCDYLERTLDSQISALETRPQTPLCQLEVLSARERTQILFEWNANAIEHEREKCLHELFEEQVLRREDSVAVSFEGVALSYGELNRRANQLAHHLRELGVGPDQRVAICMDRSLELIVALLAVLKAGGAYVPLDPSYPEERLRYMLQDSAPAVLLTQAGLRGRFTEICQTLSVLVWGPPFDERGALPETNPEWAVPVLLPAHLTYVIYTSGSTGMPKGVAMPHLPLVNLFLWQRDVLDLSLQPRTLQFSSISFDASANEIFITLMLGGTLIMIGEEERHDSAMLVECLIENEVTTLLPPFAALQLIADECHEQRVYPHSLREIVSTAEALQITPTVAQLFREVPACRLHNEYGPSETHVVSAYTTAGAPEQWPVLPPIGRPIANTQFYIVDKYFQPVPVGVQGSLYIGGSNLARGYLDKPTLTAQKFVPNPFSTTPGERLYATGDEAMYLPDGNVRFLGRRDHQVKIRGYRIELGEIEAVLARQPGIQQNVVVAREDRPGDKRLVAYAVPAAGQKIEATELQQSLRRELPEYMIPAAIIPLDVFPLTPSGKLDRKAFPAPEYKSEAGYQPPESPEQKLMCKIFGDLLGTEQVGLNDNFFMLGGHSLTAMRLVSRIRAAVGLDLKIQTVFEAPTCGELAAIIKVKLLDEIESLSE